MLEPSGGYRSRPFGEDPDPADPAEGTACVVDGKLLVDIDGDGYDEAYPTSAFVTVARAPAEEVVAVARGTSHCQVRQFALRGVVPAADPRDWRGLDVVGVADFDGDGRREIVAVYQYQGRRTWALFSASESVARLDRVGEAVPWSSR